MSAPDASDVHPVLARLHLALNQHDLNEFVGCFAPEYQSEQPVHPDRAFQGSDQVRTNWATVFHEMPDFRAELLRSSSAYDAVWAEWHWTGTQVEGTPFDWHGVTIFGISNSRITWGRLYMEPVQSTGTGIDAAVQGMTHGTQQEA